MKYFIINDEQLRAMENLLLSKEDGNFVSLERNKVRVSHQFEDIAQYDARWDTLRVITVLSSQLDESKRVGL